jgi:hypothetical protein
VRIKIHKSKVEKRCNEVIANINKNHILYYRKFVRAELIERNTEKFWFKRNIAPPKKLIDSIMTDDVSVQEVFDEIKGDIQVTRVGEKWINMAREILNAISLTEDAYVELTESDEIALMNVWKNEVEKGGKQNEKQD